MNKITIRRPDDYIAHSVPLGINLETKLPEKFHFQA